jgi:hypothetical protein
MVHARLILLVTIVLGLGLLGARLGGMPNRVTPRPIRLNPHSRLER